MIVTGLVLNQCKVVIIDVNEAALAQTKSELESTASEAGLKADVSLYVTSNKKKPNIRRLF